MFGVTSVIDSIFPAVDTSNLAVAELPQKAKVNEGQFAAILTVCTSCRWEWADLRLQKWQM